MKTIFKNNFFLLISSILFLYFFFSLLDGDRGLISYFEKKNILNKLLEQEKILKIKIKHTVYCYTKNRPVIFS